MVALHTFKKIIEPTSRLPWACLAVASAGLMAAALYFQYILGMEPCIKCVYQRAVVTILFIAFAFGYLLKSHLFGRTVAYLTLAATLYKGIALSIDHSMKQRGLDPLGFCGFKPNFPDFAKLDELLPSIFEVRGTCDTINWVFLTLTMPEWLTIAFVSMSVWISALLVNDIMKKIANDETESPPRNSTNLK